MELHYAQMWQHSPVMALHLQACRQVEHLDEELLELAATSAELPGGAATQGTSSTKLISTSGGTASALPPAMLPP